MAFCAVAKLLGTAHTGIMTTANPGDRETSAGAVPEQPRRGRRPADTFSNRLTLAIRLTGLTIRDFAEQAGLDDGSVSNWSRGMRPREMVDICQAIADAHDIEFDWLLLGGPLLPPQGRSTKRPGRVTLRYPKVAVCTRASGSNGLPRSSEAGQLVRRPRVTFRDHPVAV